MSILSKYILKKYLINFIIVLISLELFFVGIDYLQNFKNIPASANLQLLYILYNSFFTLTLALPLSIVFGWIVTLVLFIKNNEFVAFNALGATRKNIFMPVVIVSISLLITLIFLQMTPLAYSYEQKRKILNDEYFSNTKSDIFLKYNEYYVYFQKLLPLEKKAENIHIYKVKGDNLVETIIGEKAYFQNDKWYVV
ncbi:LptF/LptG family permease, partial [Aliarcobacter butzleri]|nr:LptF/LptG family permease [Aliarcobacter butzleri]